VPALVAWAASLGTVFLGAKATSAVFLGDTTEKTKNAHEATPTMICGMWLLAVGSIVLGVAPQLAVNYLLNPILPALGLGAGVHVTWLGLSADAGSFSSVGGLMLALISIVLGGLIYLIAYASRTATTGAALAGGGIFTGGEPIGEQGRLTAGDFSDIFKQHWSAFFRWTDVDRVYLGFWSVLQSISRFFGAIFGWMERRAALLVLVFAAALLVGVKFFTPGTALGESGVSFAPPLLLAACAVAALALIVAALAQSAWRKLLPLIFISSAAAVAGLAMPNPWLRLGLLELGALATIPLVWQSAKSQAAKCAYATVVLISALTLTASDLLVDRGQPDWARALLITSVCVKLAAIPFFFWLLKLADEIPALVLGTIIAVVDMAAFGELYATAQASPLMLTPQPLWLYIATGTSLIAALLMLTQRSLKRILVLSTVEDVGFLFLGLASASALGARGALVAASTHALAKALLFICLSGPEADGALEGEPVGLAARFPVSAFGFLFGMLAMLGVPPTLGFIGRWRLYSTAYNIGFCPLTIFICSSIFALIAYVLALTRCWWGPPKAPDLPPGHEPFAVKLTIVLLTILLVAAGIFPGALQTLMGVQP